MKRHHSRCKTPRGRTAQARTRTVLVNGLEMTTETRKCLMTVKTGSAELRSQWDALRKELGLQGFCVENLKWIQVWEVYATEWAIQVARAERCVQSIESIVYVTPPRGGVGSGTKKIVARDESNSKYVQFAEWSADKPYRVRGTLPLKATRE